MERKKRIGLLTLVLVIAGIVVAYIDAVVTVAYDVMPEESNDFWALAISGPVWWKINPLIFITIISVGIIAFLLGDNSKMSIRPSRKELLELAPLILTFVINAFSGLGDIMSQTFIECLRGNSPLNWLNYEWWWTRFMPLPALIAFLAGHSVPLGIDMVIGSIVGVGLLGIMWYYYYKKFP